MSHQPTTVIAETEILVSRPQPGSAVSTARLAQSVGEAPKTAERGPKPAGHGEAANERRGLRPLPPDGVLVQPLHSGGTADRAFRKAAGASERRGNNASPRSRCVDRFNPCRSAATQPAGSSMRRAPKPESRLRLHQQ